MIEVLAQLCTKLLDIKVPVKWVNLFSKFVAHFHVLLLPDFSYPIRHTSIHRTFYKNNSPIAILSAYYPTCPFNKLTYLLPVYFISSWSYSMYCVYRLGRQSFGVHTRAIIWPFVIRTVRSHPPLCPCRSLIHMFPCASVSTRFSSKLTLSNRAFELVSSVKRFRVLFYILQEVLRLWTNIVCV